MYVPIFPFPLGFYLPFYFASFLYFSHFPLFYVLYLSSRFLFCGHHEVRIIHLTDKNSPFSAGSVLSLFACTGPILFLFSFYVFVVINYLFLIWEIFENQFEVTIVIFNVFFLAIML